MPELQLSLQPRDVALLCGLFECRIMTAEHVGILYFDGKHPYTKKRLQKLKAVGYVGERTRQVNKPSILFLTRKGFNLLKSQGHLLDFPPLGANAFDARANVSELTLRHELEIMDVKAAFHAALAKSAVYSVAQFSTWPVLHQFTASLQGCEVLIKPDGFIRFHEKKGGGLSEMSFFLEVDRSSETQDTLVRRATGYLAYYQSGGFAVRHGASRTAFKDYPFRVLIVLASAERRNNTAERLVGANPPILTHAWLTTFAEASGDPTGSIWIRPADYRAVVSGTPFDTDRQGHTREYARQPRP